MTRRAYPKYKVSGVEWIGEIPVHWEIKRLKYSAKLINKKTEIQNGELRYIGLENIEPWTGEVIENETDNRFEAQGNLFDIGDVLFGKLRPYLAKALATHQKGICTSELLVLRPVDVSQKYLLYCLLNRNFIEIVNTSTYGAKMPRANWDFIGNLVVQLPYTHEQTQIAAFLDRETSRIDTLITKKERQIELLKEKRSALITHAVTKGLNTNAKMKDSGVMWIGEVPEHWEVKRLKYLLSEPFQYGANESAELDDPNLPRFVRITDIKDDGNLRADTFKSLPEEVAQPYLLEEGDLLFARSGATIGKSFLYLKSWGKSAYAGYLVRARANKNKLSPVFAKYFCQSQSYWSWLGSVFIQSTIQNVNAEKYANLGISNPPIDEQTQIASFLDRETLRIDKLIDKVQNSIETLKEYRAAIISAAVTGKIDVRGSNKSPAQKA